MDERLRRLLASEINGCHGISERRAAAQFVLDALSGNEDEDAWNLAASSAEELERAARDLAKWIRLQQGKQPQPRGET